MMYDPNLQNLRIGSRNNLRLGQMPSLNCVSHFISLRRSNKKSARRR
ncbi:hypothetical protein FOTG_18105 [Fusarium oxysporum f. sp. vasinfectum 25433]|uniref:Uncharacterized protein n=1 Tax=Fusarium oxysporum f. sp. vasinfectum 25433 TaxID=1089449 RepID=X0KII8_FUSOX|nr:hypothetical protein FOTG_18105 [Fusarium oxysporum f. sp. vasinfectum 25433]